MSVEITRIVTLEANQGGRVRVSELQAFIDEVNAMSPSQVAGVLITETSKGYQLEYDGSKRR